MDFSMDSAEYWSRFERYPVANNNRSEGIRFFDNHYFHLLEGQGYSQVGQLAGYATLANGVEDWWEILGRWETEVAPTFPAWEGRSDFRVIPDSRRGPNKNAAQVDRDISQSLTLIPYHYQGPPTFSLRNKVDWAEYRNHVQERRQAMSKDDDPSEAYPSIGALIHPEELEGPGLRVHSMRFTIPIDATIAHSVNGQYLEALVQDARLVTWIETEMRGEELSWRWLASVFSWKNVTPHSLRRCDAQTVAEIEHRVSPLVREWAHLLRDYRPRQTDFPAPGSGGGSTSKDIDPKKDPFKDGFKL